MRSGHRRFLPDIDDTQRVKRTSTLDRPTKWVEYVKKKRPHSPCTGSSPPSIAVDHRTPKPPNARNSFFPTAITSHSSTPDCHGIFFLDNKQWKTDNLKCPWLRKLNQKSFVQCVPSSQFNLHLICSAKILLGQLSLRHPRERIKILFFFSWNGVISKLQ